MLCGEFMRNNVKTIKEGNNQKYVKHSKRVKVIKES